MATWSNDSQNTEVPDLHIPPCTKRECKDRLNDLETSLTREGLSCVSQYKLNIRYKESFCDNHDKAHFTIIHKCPVLWGRLSDCQDLLSSSKKIMTVNLKGEDSQAASEAFEKFFNDFLTVDIHEDKGLSEFVLQIVELVKKNFPVPEVVESGSVGKPISFNQITRPKTPNYCNPINDDRDRHLHLSEADSEKYEYSSMPDAFGRQNVQVHLKQKSLLSESSDKYLNWLGEGHKLKHRINSSTKNKSRERMNCRKSIIFRVIPSLCTSYRLLDLAEIAVCNDQVLQCTALTVLEYLLCDGRGPEHDLDVHSLLKLESCINSSLRENCKLFYPSQHTHPLSLVQRLSNVYLMILCQVVLISNSPSDVNICNIHIKTVSAKPFAEGKMKADVYLTSLDTFLKKLNNKDCTYVRNKATIPSLNSKNAKVLLRKSLTTQAVFVFECLTKIFQTQDMDAVEKLGEYLKLSKSTSIPRSRNNSLPCIVMLLRGLIHFLNYGVAQVVDKDPQVFLEKTMEVIKIALCQKKLPTEIKSLFQSLLFSSRPEVRHFVINFLREDNGIANHLDILIQSKVENLLSPLLTVYKKKHFSEKIRSSWEIHSANFDSLDALLIVHRPSEDNMYHSETIFKGDDSLHENELNMLKNLQHPHIVELFAYQQTRIPQFYVVEDYKMQNLQILLKQCSVERNFYPRLKLLKFLTDAALGLEYIHSLNYIHRNLTAASLFIARNGVTKLCNFQLCQQLTSRKIWVKTCSALPSRWCAPESLMKNEYSKASDVWMFGHLMYEVLTHGIIPYHHIIGEVIELIKKNKVSLTKEPCIESPLFSLISECTDQVSRPSIEDVQSRLQHFVVEYKSVPRDESLIPYPARTNQKWESSTDYEMAIEATSSSTHIDLAKQYTSSTYTHELSKSLLCFKMPDRFFFHEELPTQWDSEILYGIDGGQLEGILPSVEVYQGNDGKQCIQFSLPFDCLGSLLDLTLQKKFGESLKWYLYCAYKVALTLEELFSIDWILGDIAISNLFVELLGDDINVHVVSLGYIQTWNGHYYCNKKHSKSHQTDELVISRAAPEVIFHGTYSSASDVFCFGNLLYDILTAFDQRKGASLPPRTIKSADQMHQQIVAEEWSKFHPKPECCPQKLYDLILMCVHKEDSKRPKVPELVQQIKEFCTEEPPPSLNNGSDDCSVLSELSVQNPSICSDFIEIFDKLSASNMNSEFKDFSKNSSMQRRLQFSGCGLSQAKILLTKSPSANAVEYKRSLNYSPKGSGLLVACDSAWTSIDEDLNIYQDLDKSFDEPIEDTYSLSPVQVSSSFSPVPKSFPLHRRSIPLPPIPGEGQRTNGQYKKSMSPTTNCQSVHKKVKEIDTSGAEHTYHNVQSENKQTELIDVWSVDEQTDKNVQSGDDRTEADVQLGAEHTYHNVQSENKQTELIDVWSVDEQTDKNVQSGDDQTEADVQSGDEQTNLNVQSGVKKLIKIFSQKI